MPSDQIDQVLRFDICSLFLPFVRKGTIIFWNLQMVRLFCVWRCLQVAIKDIDDVSDSVL